MKRCEAGGAWGTRFGGKASPLREGGWTGAMHSLHVPYPAVETEVFMAAERL